MATARRVYDLLDRLAATEEAVLRSDFLAPAVRGGAVHVRIAGVVCRFRVEGPASGWGVFRPARPGVARWLRSATLDERRRYLACLPQRRLILCQQAGDSWLAYPSQQAPSADGLLEVRLVEEANRFETVTARFDGAQCWFERPDERGDPAAAAYLRQAFEQRIAPEALHRKGLTGEQRTAYRIALEVRLQSERDPVELRLERSLGHAGAKLQGYIERDDVYRVEFEVEGQRHVSVVRKDDLTVQLAGICLSGADHDFDLSSLVGVLREAQADDVLRIGADNQGMDEQHYWQVHPRR